MEPDWLTDFLRLTEEGTSFVTVTVVEVRGSTPQDQGSKMIVSDAGLISGTVGGGRIEQKAIKEARDLLKEDETKNSLLVHWNLKKDVGMTCGGAMRLFFEVYRPSGWQIVIFGAGHVANALIPILLNLDCRITCYDMREEWLKRLPESPKLLKVLTRNPPAEVVNLPDSAFVLLMTMGHATDSPILAEILQTRNFPYLGVIGSAAKAARLRKDMEEAGVPKESKDRFYCPIGLPLGSNHPTEIAISIAAQLLQERDRVAARQT